MFITYQYNLTPFPDGIYRQMQKIANLYKTYITSFKSINRLIQACRFWYVSTLYHAFLQDFCIVFFNYFYITF